MKLLSRIVASAAALALAVHPAFGLPQQTSAPAPATSVQGYPAGLLKGTSSGGLAPATQGDLATVLGTGQVGATNAVQVTGTGTPVLRILNSAAPGPTIGAGGRYVEQYVDPNGQFVLRFVNGAYTSGPSILTVQSDVNSNPTLANFYAASLTLHGALAVTTAPAMWDSSSNVPTTQWVATAYLPHAASNAALKLVTAYGQPMVRDGYASAGDGGRAIYTHSPSPCTLNSGQGDGGSQIIDAAGTGCWNIDWSSVAWRATPELFGGALGVPVTQEGNINQADAGPPLQAAANTGMPIKLGPFAYKTKESILLTTGSQDIGGVSENGSRLEYFTDFLLSTGDGIFVTKPSVFDGTGLPGPVFHDFEIKGFQPELTSIVAPSVGGRYAVSPVVVAGQTVLPVANTAGLVGGNTQYIIGLGIPANATISSVQANTSVTISAPTTGYVNSFVASTASLASMYASLVQISCIDARDTIATKYFHMLIASCMRGIDMRGASGQNVIDDVQMANFIADIDIDGSQDSNHLSKIHGYPFAITANQYSLIQNTGISINLGLMDDFKITDSMCIESAICINIYSGVAETLATNGYDSPGGRSATGSIVNYDFDTVPQGLVGSAGNVSLNGGYFAAAMEMNLSGLGLRATNTNFTVNQNYAIAMSSGQVELTNSVYGDSGSNWQAVYQAAGYLLWSNNQYAWAPAGNPVLSQAKVRSVCCRFVAEGNQINDPGSNSTLNTGAGFIEVDQDGYNVVTGNAPASWPMIFPQNARYGTYAGNQPGPYSFPQGFDVTGYPGTTLRYQGIGDGCHYTYNSPLGYIQCVYAGLAWRGLDIDASILIMGSQFANMTFQFKGATFQIFAPLSKPATTSISASGTTLATCAALVSDFNEVTSVAGGAGVCARAWAGTAGQINAQDVVNAGPNALAVYPPSASTALYVLDGSTGALSAGAAYSIPVKKMVTEWCESASLCYVRP